MGMKDGTDRRQLKRYTAKRRRADDQDHIEEQLEGADEGEGDGDEGEVRAGDSGEYPNTDKDERGQLRRG